MTYDSGTAPRVKLTHMLFTCSEHGESDPGLLRKHFRKLPMAFILVQKRRIIAAQMRFMVLNGAGRGLHCCLGAQSEHRLAAYRCGTGLAHTPFGFVPFPPTQNLLVDVWSKQNLLQWQASSRPLRLG